MKIGYARVSTPEQNISNQIQQLKNNGCENVYSDIWYYKYEQAPLLTDIYNFLVKQDANFLETVDRNMKKYKIPGISIAAIHNGKIVWIKSYGYKDSQSKEKLHTRDLLQAASISKPFAVLGGLNLASENKFDIYKRVKLTKGYLE